MVPLRSSWLIQFINNVTIYSIASDCINCYSQYRVADQIFCIWFRGLSKLAMIIIGKAITTFIYTSVLCYIGVGHKLNQHVSASVANLQHENGDQLFVKSLTSVSILD